MKKIKVGFIGCGNMGGALALAVAKSELCEILLADIDSEKATELANKTGAEVTENKQIAKTAKFIFLGVKPQMMQQLIDDISAELKNRKDDFVLVSMAAGVDISRINQMLGSEFPIIRIMPNTPVSVGKGMILYSLSRSVGETVEFEFCKILRFAGKLDKTDEGFIDAGCVVSGCGPAFVYMFAESMAKAGARFGLDLEKSTEYAAQTLLGAAELMLTSGKTPETLRKEVCSPKGSTIDGVISLQNSDFDKSVNQAMDASFKRTKELGK